MLEWARSRVAVACRAAGVAPPIQSVHTEIRDLDGLRASCRAGRASGFGRTAVHPSQVAIINHAYPALGSDLTGGRT